MGQPKNLKKNKKQFPKKSKKNDFSDASQRPHDEKSFNEPQRGWCILYPSWPLWFLPPLNVINIFSEPLPIILGWFSALDSYRHYGTKKLYYYIVYWYELGCVNIRLTILPTLIFFFLFSLLSQRIPQPQMSRVLGTPWLYYFINASHRWHHCKHILQISHLYI